MVPSKLNQFPTIIKLGNHPPLSETIMEGLPGANFWEFTCMEMACRKGLI